MKSTRRGVATKCICQALIYEFGCFLVFFPFCVFPRYSSSCIFNPFFPLSTDPALKTGFEFQRISIDRSKMSEEEAFEHAIDMIQTRQMGFRKAADFFSVSPVNERFTLLS